MPLGGATFDENVGPLSPLNRDSTGARGTEVFTFFTASEPGVSSAVGQTPSNPRTNTQPITEPANRDPPHPTAASP